MYSLIILNVDKFLLKIYKKIGNHYYIVFELKNNNFIYIKIPENIFIINLNNKFLCLSKKLKLLKLFKYLLYNKLLSSYFFSWKIGIYLFGLGFKFLELSSKSITLRLGYSHKIKFNLIKGIKIKKSKFKKNSIILICNNKINLFNTISILRKIRYPDIYKGRGVRLFWEIFKFKNVETNWNR